MITNFEGSRESKSAIFRLNQFIKFLDIYPIIYSISLLYTSTSYGKYYPNLMFDSEAHREIGKSSIEEFGLTTRK